MLIETVMVYQMIKKSNLLLFLLFFMACASIDYNAEMSKEFEKVDPEFSLYVQDFIGLTSPYYQEAALSGLSLGKKRLNSKSAIGICKIFTTNGGPEILVDKDFWAIANESEREALVLHELGHCLCGLDHQHFEGSYGDESVPRKVSDRLKKGYLEDGCPNSLMHPIVISPSCYSKHRDHYRFELRLRCYTEKVRLEKRT